MPISSQGYRAENQFQVDNIIIRGRDSYAIVTNDVISLDVYESLDSLVQGSFIISDTAGVVDLLQITGEESIDIHFRSRTADGFHKEYKKTFRVDTFTRFMDKTGQIELVEFFFINQAVIENNLIKKSQVYKNKSVSEVIRSILGEFRSLSTSNIDIEDTLHQRTFHARFKKPFEVIHTLMQNAASKVNRSCKFMFYEDRDGIKFRSLGSLKSVEPKLVITKEAHSDKLFNPSSNRVVSLRLHTTKGADIYNSTQEAEYGVRIYSHSLINKTIDVIDLTATKSARENPTLNDSPLRKEQEINDTEGVFNTVLVRSSDGFYENDHVPQGHVNAVRMMENGMNNKGMVAEIPGNTSLTVGDIVTIEHLTLSNASQSEVAGGKWLIKNLAHKLNLGGDTKTFTTELILTSDSMIKGK